MAQQTVIPQHVTALLSHLTSRPGVQSTFILSRKDGSIIQSTGLLAAELATRDARNTARPAQATSPVNEAASPSPTSPVEQQQQQQQQQPEEQPEEPHQEEGKPEQQEGQGEQGPGQGDRQEQKQAYQPTHAEALAAHIFAFVSSASELSMSLSHPPDDRSDSKPNGNHSLSEGHLTHGMSSASGREEGEEQEKEEDDEVKLLRLRTKKHEIVVVPDRKYLLCVVHDAAHSVGMGGRGR